MRLHRLQRSPREVALRLLYTTFLALALAGAVAAGEEREAEGVALHFGGGEKGAVEVSNFDPSISAYLQQLAEAGALCPRALAIYTGEELPSKPRPPVLGKCQLIDGALRFLPRFPWQRGQAYVARFLDSETGEARLLSFRVDTVPVDAGSPQEKRAVVTAIYPSTSEVPANLLKLYIHFSVPMERGRAADHLRVMTAAGDELQGVFVAPGHELWDPTRQRLTVFFDPGRIKRGLRPHLEQGTLLESGKTYRVVVDSRWRDSSGSPMAAPFEKTYRTHAPDRESPQPTAWQLRAPASAEAALEIEFPEPLDHALLHRLLQVFDAAGRLFPGEVEVDRGETRWRFTPNNPWAAGRYEVRVSPELEDLAGNSLLRVFDLEMRPSAATGEGENREAVRIPFEALGKPSAGEAGAL